MHENDVKCGLKVVSPSGHLLTIKNHYLLYDQEYRRNVYVAQVVENSKIYEVSTLRKLESSRPSDYIDKIIKNEKRRAVPEKPTSVKRLTSAQINPGMRVMAYKPDNQIDTKYPIWHSDMDYTHGQIFTILSTDVRNFKSYLNSPQTGLQELVLVVENYFIYRPEWLILVEKSIDENSIITKEAAPSKIGFTLLRQPKKEYTYNDKLLGQYVEKHRLARLNHLAKYKLDTHQEKLSNLVL